ncbi:MAG: hypothetical protein QOI77_1897 [Blastocatellia bacterium]|nr:hypothetical protein [Blastocatellia bacterium]
MAKPSKFAHVVYSTRRFEEMVDWYQSGLRGDSGLSKSGIRFSHLR